MKRRQRVVEGFGSRYTRPAPEGDAAPVGRPHQYRERLAREEAEAAAAEQRKFDDAQNDFSQTLRELNKSQKELTRELWGRPLDCIDNPDSWSGDLAVDTTIGLQNAAKRFDISTDASTLRAVAVGFELKMKELTGYTLNEDGAKRLLYFGFAQAIHGKDLTTVAAWSACFERLVECHCFDDGEIEFHEGAKKVVPRPAPTPVEQPRPSKMDELMATNVETREGRLQANRLAEELYFDQMAPLVRKWHASVKGNFGFEIPLEDMRTYVTDWFTRNNKSWLDHRAFDEFRPERQQV
jgi:hypothetical protein